MKQTVGNFEYDFSGYATKVGIKATDGRTIMADAFAHNDGNIVPLVWQHLHGEPDNILGRALLENRKDGVYSYCSLNSSEKSAAVRHAISHGDIKALSIYANQLVEKGDKKVVHGDIREVSLAVVGANPGAVIDNVAFAHADGSEIVDETEVIISFNEALDYIAHSNATSEKTPKKSVSKDVTVADIFETMTEEQKEVVYILVGQAVQDAKKENSKDVKHTDEGDTAIMKHNVFSSNKDKDAQTGNTLSHADMQAIIATANRTGSLREAFLAHSITNVEYLFPEAKTLTKEPQLLVRKMEWVKDVFDSARHTPFSRVKSIVADLTPDEARARGYIKGNLKTDQVLALLKRITIPTTIYKKQSMDRDDVLDITDLDIVRWLKAEMRVMLVEEIARAILVSDGRALSSPDKIPTDNVRPIYNDADLYTVRVTVPESSDVLKIMDEMVKSRSKYQGSGNPTLFVSPDFLSEMLLIKDTTNRRIYKNTVDLAAALRVKKIVEVPAIENTLIELDATNGLLLKGIIVNMKDYSIGADKGGQVNLFEDFDIDYNRQKYLIETRLSGALTLPHSAIAVFEEVTIP